MKSMMFTGVSKKPADALHKFFDPATIHCSLTSSQQYVLWAM